MSHIAFFSTPALGHLNPMIAVVAELVRRGHRVTCTATGARAGRFESVGATVVPYTSTRPADHDPALRVPRGRGYVGESLLNFLVEARHTLPQLEPLCANDRPDLVVHDRIAFVARILAAKYDIETVETWPILISTEHYADTEAADAFDPTHPAFLTYVAELGELLVEQGIAVEPDKFLAPVAARHVAFFPRVFQHGSDSFDDRYHFVGPCLRAADTEGAWQPPSSGARVVMITLGSLDNNRPDFYRTCLEAFADPQWHVVIAVGRRFDPSTLGPVPSHVEIRAVVPQLAVLAHAAAFVSHAGMGGVMESANAGVPHVAIPLTPEQSVNAARIVDLGIGVRLSLTGLRPDALRGAVDRVASDPSVAARLDDLRTEIATAGGPTRAADVIESALPPV